MTVRIRLTRKLAERIDGVDLTARRVGDVIDLPTPEARLLVAEEWATTEERRQRHVAVAPPFDRRGRKCPAREAADDREQAS